MRKNREGAVHLLLELITREDDFDSIGREFTRIVGEGFGAGRCYVFRYADSGVSDCCKLFEWTDPEAVVDAPHWPEDLRNRLVECPTIVSETELICGLWIRDRLYGFVGVDLFRNKRNFSDSEIGIMNDVANLFVLAFRQTHQHEQLRDGMSLQRQIMDNLPIPILLVDSEYRVLAANPTKKIDVGLPLSKLLGSRCYDTVCKCGAPPAFCAAQETMRTKQPGRKEFSFGGKQLISTSQPIFDRQGEMQYVLSVDIDITEVTRQKEELKIAMEQAQAANLAKSYFLATVSHELRTPLNAVIGFSELLENGNVDEETRREYLRSINFSGTALLNLINDVLDLSNLEANQTLIAPVKSDIGELIDQVAAVFKLKVAQKHIELKVKTDVTSLLFVDNLRLRQVLLNLIGNAVKFTSEGGVTIEATFVPGEEKRGVLTICVSDTGIGIAPENRARIFEPFVHDSVIRGSRMYEGSGLGLTISHRLLNKMGGNIRVESELGKGSTFIIELNVEYEAPAEASAVAEDAAASAAVTICRPRRVLMVDDVLINLKVLEAMLKRMNVASSLAGSSDEAIELLRRDRNYDMILTDMWMPGANGAELAKCVREELGIVDIPILAITADTQIPEEDRGAFAYILYKPITMKSLEQMFRILAP